MELIQQQISTIKFTLVVNPSVLTFTPIYRMSFTTSTSCVKQISLRITRIYRVKYYAKWTNRCTRYRDLYSRARNPFHCAFCEDAADEHKNGHAYHSLIRFNSWTSVNAAKKSEMQIASGAWNHRPIIIDNFVHNRANYRVHLCESPRWFDIFHQDFLLQSVISIEPSSRKLLMKVKQDEIIRNKRYL